MERLSDGPTVIFTVLGKERHKKTSSREGEVVTEGARAGGDSWEGAILLAWKVEEEARNQGSSNLWKLKKGRKQVPSEGTQEAWLY